MMWIRAIWLENDGSEFDGVIPENWLDEDTVFYPKGLHVKKYFHERKNPEADWSRFKLVKIKLRSSDRRLFEEYSLPSDPDRSNTKGKTSIPSNSNTEYPKLPKLNFLPPSFSPTSPPYKRSSHSPAANRRSSPESSPEISSPIATRVSPRRHHQMSSPDCSPPVQNKAPVRKSFAAAFGASFNERRSTPSSALFKETSRKRAADAVSSSGSNTKRTNSSHDKYPLTDAKFQSKVIYLLTDIRNQQRQMALNNVNTTLEETLSSSIRKCENIEEFDHLESSLGEKKAFDDLVKQLSKLGGSTPQDITRNAMHALMTNSLMGMFNMKGKKGAKVAFTKKKICDAIIACVMANHKEATISVILAKMANVLKYAPDRLDGGGRARNPVAEALP